MATECSVRAHLFSPFCFPENWLRLTHPQVFCISSPISTPLWDLFFPMTLLHGRYSPLELRSTIGRIRICPRPWSTFLFLVWPCPWKYDLPHPLLSVEEIRECPTIHAERQPGIRQLYNIPIYRMRDTPLRSLYRLYEDLCASDFIMIGYETTYFYFHSEPSWSLISIPDPKDPDPVRYAILASMVEALVEAFNWRLELGIYRDNTTNIYGNRSSFTKEQAPSWTSNVGPIATPLAFCERTLDISEVTLEQNFLKRNIKMQNGYLYTV